MDENYDRRTLNNRIVDDRAADGKGLDDRAVNNNNDRRKSNNQNNNRDSIEEQEKSSRLGKGSFLDKTWSSILFILEKALFNILEGVKPGTLTSDTSKKLI